MERVAFQLRIREGMTEAYDEAHRHVWPEMLAELRQFGIKEYSIFRRDQQLFLYMQVANFQRARSTCVGRRRWNRSSNPFQESVLMSRLR